jgi:hypothetical protein
MRQWNSGWRGAALALLALGCTAPAWAQRSEMTVDQQTIRGRYAVLKPRLTGDETMTRAVSSSALQTWNGSFTYGKTKYTYNMVGTAPSSNTSATIPVYVIPVKIVITHSFKTYTYDPEHKLSNGNTVVTNTTDSPLFENLSYSPGGTNVGTTQFVDAFQRANFWGTVSSHPNSHLYVGRPSVEAEQTLKIPSSYGTLGAPFGFTAGLVDIDYFDAQVPTILSRLGIQPNSFAIFLTYDVYLTQNRQCCIGGYHSSEGSVSNPHSYAEATYVDHTNTFAQDVSALSHEMGEWADDPLTINYNGNQTPCGILEVGDPLENTAHYGDHAYSLHGFTYHLQDLAMMRYFGAPSNTSVHGWYSFNDYPLSVCSNGS